MISVELARELKEAGLVWKPEEGDRYYWRGNYRTFNASVLACDTRIVKSEPENCIWIPRADQLLATIEEHGLDYRLTASKAITGDSWLYEIRIEEVCYAGKIREETIAIALLWTIEHRYV